MRHVVVVLFSSILLVTCVGGAPVPCTECGGKCVDTAVDSNNCGECGKVCAVGTRCEASACVATNVCGLDCGAHGTCTKVGAAAPTCTCHSDYGGDRCDACATGFQDRDGNGRCEPDCTSVTCSNGGTCDDATGIARCSCGDAGYTGTTCTNCAAGFQDNDGDGTCREGCARAALTCSNGGACSDATGTAACACTAAYTGATCAACATGFQDEDGDGRCSAACTTVPLSPDAGSARVMLRLPAPVGIVAGSAVAVPLGEPSVVNAWLQPDGGGVSLLLHELDGGLTPIARAFNVLPAADGGPGAGADAGENFVQFRVRDAIRAGTTNTQYGLYRSPLNNVSGTSVLTPAVRTDNGASLLCDTRSNFFFTIQFRQIGNQLYEIVVADGTGDSGAYARITVTDAVTNSVLLDRNYTNGAGTCCTAPTIIARDTLAITTSSFKVRLETREFSGTHRYFGCEDFGTGNPPTSQVGTNEFTYVVSNALGTLGGTCQ